MNEQNIFKNNILINNNSFSNQKNINLPSISLPFRNLKLSNKKNYSLTAIDINTNNSNIGNKYLLTEFKTKKKSKNNLAKSFSGQEPQNENLLIKNKTFLESPLSIIKISKQNSFNKNKIKDKYNSYYTKTNYKMRNSKIDLNRISSYINTSYSINSNDSLKSIKKNNIKINSNINISSKMTQTSTSFHIKNNSHIKKSKFLELNLENDKTNNNLGLNKVNYIDLHINKILSNEDEIRRRKIEYLLIRKYKNINKELSNFIYNPIIDYKKEKPYKNFNEIIKYNEANKEKNKEKNNNSVNYVNFKDRLDNLYHKILVVEDNKEYEEICH